MMLQVISIWLVRRCYVARGFYMIAKVLPSHCYDFAGAFYMVAKVLLCSLCFLNGC